MQTNQEGKVVVVIGATGGIGIPTVKALYDAGNSVVIASRTELKLNDLKASFPDQSRILTVPMDITIPADVERVLTESVREFGHVDAVFNCAGTWAEVTIDTPPDAAHAIMTRHFDEHAKAVLIIGDVFQRYFREQRSGLIVAVTSHAGYRPELAGNLTYGSAKAAAQQYLKALREALQGTAVRVSDISPSVVNTPDLYDRLGSDEVRAAAIQPEAIAQWFVENLDNPDIEPVKHFVGIDLK